jgi:enoyl-CoA hydratase/carnithine racemase
MGNVVRLDKEGMIGMVTIDNLPTNSLSIEVISGLESAFDQVLSDESVRAMIVTGSGDKIFAAGANIKELADMDKEIGISVVSRIKEVFAKMWLSPKPVFCAMNGHALGGGLELALHCDFRIAVEAARLGQPEINLSVLPGAGGTQLLPRLTGLSKGRWLLLSGETISAKEAFECGLVDRVVKPESLLDATKEMATKIAEKSPLAVAAIKKLLRYVQSPGLEEAMKEETALFGALCATEDKKEGVQAFLEKRKPNFRGR